MHTKITCPLCHGNGEVECRECSGEGKETCPHCHGTGFYAGDKQCIRCQATGYLKEKCSVCNGTGKETCKLCDGMGKTTSKAILCYRLVKFFLKSFIPLIIFGLCLWWTISSFSALSCIFAVVAFIYFLYKFISVFED